VRRGDAAQRYTERNHRPNVVAFERPCRRATLMLEAADPLCERGKGARMPDLLLAGCKRGRALPCMCADSRVGDPTRAVSSLNGCSSCWHYSLPSDSRFPALLPILAILAWSRRLATVFHHWVVAATMVGLYLFYGPAGEFYQVKVDRQGSWLLGPLLEGSETRPNLHREL
jgi:hypothetical protein